MTASGTGARSPTGSCEPGTCGFAVHPHEARETHAPEPEFATCTGCGVVITCRGDGEGHFDLPTQIEMLADEFERGALFRTGSGVARRLRALLSSARLPTTPEAP